MKLIHEDMYLYKRPVYCTKKKIKGKNAPSIPEVVGLNTFDNLKQNNFITMITIQILKSKLFLALLKVILSVGVGKIPLKKVRNLSNLKLNRY